MALAEEAGMAPFFLSPLNNATGTSKVWINIGPRMSYTEDCLAVKSSITRQKRGMQLLVL